MKVTAGLLALGAALTCSACEPKADTTATPVAADGKAEAGRPSFDQALIHQTGDKKLGAITAVSWTGKAVVHFNGQSLELGVETRIEPYATARSASWPSAQGRAASRTMIIEGDKGFVDREGRRDLMPEPQAAHERQQFGLYGLMLLETLRDGKGKVEFVDDRCFTATHANAPETAFCINDQGALVRASNDVPDPENPSRRLHQEITFAGEVSDNGIVWPKQIFIRQQGAPYFDLTIETFKVERAE